MSHNTDAMVQELRAEFESMLSYVRYGRSTTADQVERGVFRRLLNLGVHLMWLFLALRSERAGRERYQTPSGETLPYWAERPRQYFSIFGKLTFWRPYFYRQGAGGASPWASS